MKWDTKFSRWNITEQLDEFLVTGFDNYLPFDITCHSCLKCEFWSLYVPVLLIQSAKRFILFFVFILYEVNQ